MQSKDFFVALSLKCSPVFFRIRISQVDALLQTESTHVYLLFESFSLYAETHYPFFVSLSFDGTSFLSRFQSKPQLLTSAERRVQEER